MEPLEKLTTQGLPLYIAHSLSVKNQMVIGTLFKKSNSKTANLLGTRQFLKRYIHIDFRTKKFTH